MSSHWLISIFQEKNIITEGEYTLKSGEKTNFYIDLRKLISYPSILEKISFVLSQKVRNLEFDRICAIPYGGLPIATIMSLQLKKPMIFFRKQSKNHGISNIIEGNWEEGDRILFVDDVITTGTSIKEAKYLLKFAKFNIIGSVVVVDRSDSEIDLNMDLISCLKLEDL